MMSAMTAIRRNSRTGSLEATTLRLGRQDAQVLVALPDEYRLLLYGLVRAAFVLRLDVGPTGLLHGLGRFFEARHERVDVDAVADLRTIHESERILAPPECLEGAHWVEERIAQIREVGKGVAESVDGIGHLGDVDDHGLSHGEDGLGHVCCECSHAAASLYDPVQPRAEALDHLENGRRQIGGELRLEAGHAVPRSRHAVA
jgi:hypothetical protein